MSGSVARRFVVTGRVQGVFFRDSTRRRAQELDVSGWVRNASDGSVEGVFEGPREAVDAALAFVREGPPDAAVDAVETSEAEPSDATGFEIR